MVNNWVNEDPLKVKTVNFVQSHVDAVILPASLVYQGCGLRRQRTWSDQVSKRENQKYSVYMSDSKMVGCEGTIDMSFVQFLNCDYRTVNKVKLLNSTYIIPSRTNVNKQLAVNK